MRREVRPNVSLQRPWSPGSKPPSPSPQPSAPPSKAIPYHLHQPSYHDKCKATLLHFQAYLIFVNFVTPTQIFSPVNQKYTKKSKKRWVLLHVGQGSISLEYQTYNSAHPLDTLELEWVVAVVIIISYAFRKILPGLYLTLS